MACLNLLPVELLHHVCDYLNCKEVLEWTMTNRYFNTYLYPNLFQNVVIRSSYNLHLFLTAIDNGQHNESPLGWKTKTFKLQYTSITALQLTTLVNECPNITELDVDNMTWLNICPHKGVMPWNPRNDAFRHYLNMTFTKYTNLTSLTLNLTGYRSQTIDIYQVLALLPRLFTLNLLDVFHVFTMNDMEKIHTHCSRLLELNISGFCLNRARPTHPIMRNSTLCQLSIKFSSGWSYYYHWLWYIGRKYTGLSSVACECTTTMGIRAANATDEQEMIEGFTVFAQQHALTLQKLEFINLNIDERLVNALQTPSLNLNDVTDTTDLMQLDLLDDTPIATIEPETTLAHRTTAMTNLRLTNSTTTIRSEIFLGIIQYVQDTVRSLNISWPFIDNNNYHLRICTSLTACRFLTDLTLELPRYMFGLMDGQNTVPLDRILRSCPSLTSLNIINGKIYIASEDDPMGNNNNNSNTHQPFNYPLKKLLLRSVYLPTCLLVMENYGLINIECVMLDHCSIYGLAYPTISDPGIILDWLFHIPSSASGLHGGDNDSTLTVPRRSLSVNILHTQFVNPDPGRRNLLCGFITLSQYGKGEEISWSLRRSNSYTQKMVRMSSPMFRRKSGQVKRKNNRRQAPSDFQFTDNEHVAPNVGIQISCHSMDSLRVNGRKLL